MRRLVLVHELYGASEHVVVADGERLAGGDGAGRMPFDAAGRGGGDEVVVGHDAPARDPSARGVRDGDAMDAVLDHDPRDVAQGSARRPHRTPMAIQRARPGW
jgi:hypothetical protein